MPDLLFILFLGLIILGPKKLPQIAAQAAKFLAQFQRMKRDLLDQVNGELLRIEEKQTIEKASDSSGEVAETLASVRSETPAA
ncbi:MAG: twin-arginine translocase TatA/TatE family subunit [Candidatus Korobacteraceae bacterium]|jgi:sec-independent protein translocase protein TatB